MKDEELFKAWKSEQYKDQSTEEKMEFVEHLHTFPKYFEKTFLAGLKAGRPQWHYVKDGIMAYHFLYGGGIWWKGEYIQDLNEWDFRHLIEGQKVKNHKAPKPKTITLTCTEKQLRKAKQLYYAMKIGFNIRGKDYQRWHLL